MAGTADILFKAELDSSGAITSLQAIAGETGKLGTAAGTATPQLAGLGVSIGSVVTALGGFATVAGAITYLKDAMGAAVLAEQAYGRLQGVLAATGNTSGLSAGQIDNFATHLRTLTGITVTTTEDAAAMLATFDIVRGDAFERTLTAAANLAAVFGGDLTSSVIGLARAMVQPENAALGLRQAHIKLTEAQADYITSVTLANGADAGRTAILEIVESKVNGAATAVANSAGGVKLLGSAWDTFKIAVGEAMTGVTTSTGLIGLLTDALKGAAFYLSGLSKEEVNFKTAVGQLTTGELATLYRAMQDLIAQDKAKLIAIGDEGAGYLDLNQKLQEHERELGLVKTALDGQTTATDSLMKKDLDERDAADLAARARDAHADALSRDVDWLGRETYGLGDWTRLQNGETVAVSDSNFVHGMHQKAMEDDAQAVADLAHQTDLSKMAAFLAGQEYHKWSDIVLVPLKVDPLIITVTLDRAKAAYEAQWLQNYWDTTVTHLEDSLKNVTTALFEGDANKAWENMWKDASKAAGKIMSDTLEEALFGGQGPLSGDKGFKGVLQGGWGSMSTTQKLESGGQLLGAGLMYYGAQNQDRTATVIGGAIAGAMSMAETGFGAILGFIIGGLLAYLSSKGTSAYGYNIVAGSGAPGARPGMGDYYYTAGQAGVGFDYGGPDVDTMKDMARQLSDVIESTTVSMRNVLTTMGQPLAFPSWSALWTGQTTDAGKVFQSMLTNLAPRAVLAAYTPFLQTGMTGIGVSAGRQAQELASFDTGKFDTALASFTAWIQAIMDMGSVDKLLGQTPDELRAKVNETLRGAFLTGFDDTMTKAKELTASLDQMFSSEQVTNAQQLLSLANSQYAAGLQYFQQLESISKGIAGSTADVLTGFEEEKAKEAGPGTLADWYKQQLADLNTSLAGATSAEQVQSIMSEILKYGQSLWNLNMQTDTSKSPDYAFRQQAEADIVAAEKAAQDMIAGWEKEVSDKNALLKDQIDLMTDALTSATGAQGAQATAIDGSTAALNAFTGSLVSSASAADSLAAAFDAVAASAAAAAGFTDASSLGRQA